jgi:hypothetical protein
LQVETIFFVGSGTLVDGSLIYCTGSATNGWGNLYIFFVRYFRDSPEQLYRFSQAFLIFLPIFKVDKLLAQNSALCQYMHMGIIFEELFAHILVT